MAYLSGEETLGLEKNLLELHLGVSRRLKAEPTTNIKQRPSGKDKRLKMSYEHY